MQKITTDELINKIRNIDISDEEISKFLKVSNIENAPFTANIVIDDSKIDDNGFEGARLISALNSLSKWRRKQKYKQKIKSWNGIKIVSEGDSWFQYPFILKDTIDQLSDNTLFSYAIYDVSEAGDLLSNMIKEDELTQAIEKENPDIFLISAGGNDLLGHGNLENMIDNYVSGKKFANYLNQNFDEILEKIDYLYRNLFDRLLIRFPHLKIVIHGYDYAIPNEGIWLGKPFLKKGIKREKLQKDITGEIINRFNKNLEKISSDYSGYIYFADCRNIIGEKNQWHDELHPKNTGYLKVAEKIDDVIQQAISERNNKHEQLPLSEHINLKNGQPLQNLKRLDDEEFEELVYTRAKKTVNEKLSKPATKNERRVIENYLEKINKESDFLPSSFLEVGVSRAQAVCRISSKTSNGIAYGTGFLIGTKNYLMTNHHVIPDIDTALKSIAEFDYDQDNIEYYVDLKPEQCFISDPELDFTIIACDPSTLPPEIEAIPFPNEKHLITRKERVNIIQHPDGRRKEIALHDNRVSYVYDKAIRYSTDTEGGSSGSPVFNNAWELCALHHAGWENNDGSASNEGILIACIFEFINNLESPKEKSHLESILYKTPKTKSHIHRDQKIKHNEHQKNTVTLNINTSRKDVVININD